MDLQEAKQVKALASNLSDLCLILRTNMEKERTNSHVCTNRAKFPASLGALWASKMPCGLL